MTKTDVIIIGSGPGGYRTACYAAQNGLQVIIIESDDIGGTCLNCGCIPTKTLCHEADVIETARNIISDIPINITKIIEHKQDVVNQLRKGVEQLLSSPGITLIKGQAKFKDQHTIIVGDDEYAADNIIIATGSKPKMPPIKGIDNEGVLTSTDILNIDHIPNNICIIGAGVIGMEFASIFNTFGSNVTVVEFQDECLPPIDVDIAKRLRKCMEKRGIVFYLQSGVNEISKVGDSLNISFTKKDKQLSIDADIVLVSTGRVANTDGLQLENTNISLYRSSIPVNDNMQTNVDGIYAIGDVNAKCMLAHAATFQGFRAINHIIGKKDNIRFDIIPSVIFTSPEAAGVGLTEKQCTNNAIEYNVRKGYYRSNGKALAINSTEGLIKLISTKDDKIIGCHIYGAHASDMVQEIVSLMNNDITVKSLGEIIHAHPTLSEILQDMAL